MEEKKSSKLDLVFTDILGPMPTTSLGGNRYAISFTDSYSRYSAVYFLKSKEECLDKFKVFCAQDLYNSKIFGCTAFKHIEKHQDKISDKATKEVFVGYSEDSEAYILYNPYSKKTSFSRNVSFDETSFDFFAAHPSQNIRAFVTERPAPKQVLPETQKHFAKSLQFLFYRLKH